MKKLNKYLFMLMSVSLLISCTEPDEIALTGSASGGGLLEVQTPLLNYVVGEVGAAYEVEVLAYQSGSLKTQSIEVKAVFQTVERDASGALVYRAEPEEEGELGEIVLDPADGSTTAVFSNELSLGQMILSEAVVTGSATLSVTFADLSSSSFTISGTSYNNGAIPTDDVNLVIGDAWNLTFESTTSEGKVHVHSGTSKIAVSTRFAGIYVVSNSSYQHPSGAQPGFDGDEIVIESVDPVTYHILANGPFTLAQDPDNEFYFTIDPTSLVINIPKEYNGATQTVWGVDEVANCNDDPGEFTQGQCANTDFAVKDDVNGADMLVMSHGYIRSSGTREFKYTLTKKL